MSNSNKEFCFRNKDDAEFVRRSFPYAFWRSFDCRIGMDSSESFLNCGGLFSFLRKVGDESSFDCVSTADRFDDGDRKENIDLE
jgi:hypothetical protein